MKVVLWDLAYMGLDGHAPWKWLQRLIPDEWGYRGPMEASYMPRPTPWLFRGDNGQIALAVISALALVAIWW